LEKNLKIALDLKVHFNWKWSFLVEGKTIWPF